MLLTALHWIKSTTRSWKQSESWKWSYIFFFPWNNLKGDIFEIYFKSNQSAIVQRAICQFNGKQSFTVISSVIILTFSPIQKRLIGKKYKLLTFFYFPHVQLRNHSGMCQSSPPGGRREFFSFTVHSRQNWPLHFCLTSYFVLMSQRNALSEVTACLRERLHRWQKIEHICGFPIIRNPGLVKLTAQLYVESASLNLPRMPQAPWSCHSSLHSSLEDLLEESASPMLQKMTGKGVFTLHSNPTWCPL